MIHYNVIFIDSRKWFTFFVVVFSFLLISSQIFFLFTWLLFNWIDYQTELMLHSDQTELNTNQTKRSQLNWSNFISFNINFRFPSFFLLLFPYFFIIPIPSSPFHRFIHCYHIKFIDGIEWMDKLIYKMMIFRLSNLNFGWR